MPLRILVFRTEFVCEIIYGYVSGARESNGDINFFHLYRVTLKVKVFARVRGCGATP